MEKKRQENNQRKKGRKKTNFFSVSLDSFCFSFCSSLLLPTKKRKKRTKTFRKRRDRKGRRERKEPFKFNQATALRIGEGIKPPYFLSDRNAASSKGTPKTKVSARSIFQGRFEYFYFSVILPLSFCRLFSILFFVSCFFFQFFFNSVFPASETHKKERTNWKKKEKGKRKQNKRNESREKLDQRGFTLQFYFKIHFKSTIKKNRLSYFYIIISTSFKYDSMF